MKDTIEKLVEDIFWHKDKQKAIIQLMALMRVRNNSKPTCTDCKSEDVTKSGYYQSTGKDSGDFYGCNDCGKEFDVQRYYGLEFFNEKRLKPEILNLHNQESLSDEDIKIVNDNFGE